MERRVDRMSGAGRASAITRMLGPAALFSLHLLLLLLVSGGASAGGEQRCAKPAVVVKIHADWCGTCKALDAVWKQLGDEAADVATLVELDVSDRVAYGTSRARAQQLGITEFFEEYRSQTGTIAVLACDSNDPVEILVGERDLGKYYDAIAKAGGSS